MASSAPKDSGGGDDGEAIKNQVREALRGQKVKLWDPPFVNHDREPVAEALENLLAEWQKQNILNDATDRSMILVALKELQLHALAKWKAKQQAKKSSPVTMTNGAAALDLEIKILGNKDAMNSKDIDGGDFARSVEVNNNQQKGPIVLRLTGVAARKTDVELLQFLNHKVFCLKSNVRLIYRGKNVTASGTPLSAIFTAGGVVQMLCLVSRSNPQEDQRMAQHTNIQGRIAAIRNAALQIRDTTRLEITDQNGETVPMTKEDRLGFLTALALHRMGMNGCSTKEDALVLLLEADVEWNNHPNLQAWKDRVDNYGLLQLDIAWIYLQLESLSNLPDSLKRLAEAERVLRKQVHVNFVTLALLNAEGENAREVPPLAAVFAKLFLLQGIAHLCESRENNNPVSARISKERLDQAFLLLQSLRSVASDESVQRLLEVSNSAWREYSTSDAIAALRKAHGDLDTAAMALAEEETNRLQRHRDREAQRRHGLCQNETDPVDLSKLEQLQPLLQGACADAQELAVGLLRLANNDMTRALNLYKEHDHDPLQVQAELDALDKKLVQRGLLGRSVLLEKQLKKRKLFDTSTRPVDEVALVTLESMGVDHDKAKVALQKNGNDVDKALTWITTQAAVEEAAAFVASASNGNGNDNDTQCALSAAAGGEGEGMGEESGVDGLQERIGRGAAAAAAAAAAAFATLPRGAFRGLTWTNAERDAQELLDRELGNILEERDLEKEYLGKDLNEEWQLVLKYRQSN